MDKTERAALIIWMCAVWFVIEIIIAEVWLVPHWWLVWGIRIISGCTISGLVTLTNGERG